jgi:uncharacterized lipoprotein
MTPPIVISASRALSRMLLLSALAVALAACAGHGIRRVLRGHDCNKPQPYQSAGSLPPLKVPVGIDPADTRNALRIPAYNEPTPPPRKLTDPCLDAPPPFATRSPPVAPATKSVSGR